MAETLQEACTPPGAKKWHWFNIQRDLVQQGGLEDKDVMIHPFSVIENGAGGAHKGNEFYISWVKDKFLLVTSREHNQALVDAFARVVEYKPFARYREPESVLVTTEWDKVDPEGRYQELQREGKLELTRLLE